MYHKPMLDVTEDEFDRLYDINVKSIFHMTNAVVPIMRPKGMALSSTLDQLRDCARARPDVV